jgi:hypothetical protein
LTQHVESVVQKCIDKASPLPHLMERSISCPDAFCEEDFASLESPHSQCDAAEFDKVPTCPQASKPARQASGTATPMWRDGGTGGCQHEALLKGIEKRVPACSSPATPLSALAPAPAPPECPAASKRQQAPTGGARRLRSGSPGLRLVDGGPVPLPELRTYSPPRCSERAAE